MKPGLSHMLACEVLGTFILVFIGTGAIVVNAASGGAITHLGVALCFGLVVMAMIYTVGDVSGAHLNPAVTLAFWVAGRMQWTWVIPYITAQVVGAVAASGVVLLLLGNHASLGATVPRGSALQAFAIEIVLSWILMFVILHVSTGPKEVGMLAGVAIGGVIAMLAAMGGPVTGASMNPARSLAPAVVSLDLRSIWVYLSAPFIGTMLAVPCWLATRPVTSPVSPSPNAST